MIAAGKKNKLKMKYPMKLWPFRPATRAGQNAIAIQMAANKIHQMTDMVVSPFAFVQNALACYRTAASAPSTLPHRAVVRTTRASPQEG